MDFDLSALLNHNSAPTEEIVNKVKNLLVAPRQRLEEIETEMEHHERMLDALRREHSNVTNSMKDYNIIISPVRRLPEDILLAIFYQCLPTHRNPVMSGSEAPILLTHVCSTWRSLILASPQMWARIHIIFSDQDCLHPDQLPSTDGHTGSTDLDTVKAIQNRCEKVEEWLSLSQACPLSISMHYESRVWPSQICAIGDLTERLFNIIYLNVRRWSSIEVTGIPYLVFLKLDSLISEDDLPMLTHLRLGINHAAMEAPGVTDYQQRSLRIQEAPNLRSVSLKMPLNWKFIDPRLSSAWTTITYLCLHNPSPVHEIFALLQVCHNLVHCKLYLEDYTGLGSEPATGAVTLNYLKYLHVYEYAQDTTAIDIYASIHAPHLQQFTYQRQLYDPGELEDEFFQPSVLHLLRQATELKKLTLEPSSLSKPNILRAFQALPSITNLCIGWEAPVFPRPLPVRGLNFPNFYRRSPSSARFNLKLLTVSNFPNSQHIPSSASLELESSSLLLPNLEVFEIIESEAAPILSDATLQEFITSRLDLYSKGVASPLRRVRARFDRAQTEDIREEVLRHAKSVGVDFTLELDYLPPQTSKAHDPLSLNYLLLDPSAPTWPHTEIEVNYL